MIELIFVRHGQTDWNLEKKLQGIIDIPLNSTGRYEAAELSKDFHMEINYIISSTLSRAYETAEILNRKLNKEIISDSRLVERDFGKLAGEKADFSRTVDRDLYDVEPISSMESKITSFLEDCSKLNDGKYLVVTHGGVVSIMLSMLTRGGITWENKPIENCSLTSVFFNKQWEVNYIGLKKVEEILQQ